MGNGKEKEEAVNGPWSKDGINWSKFLAREFLVCVLFIGLATWLCFEGKIDGITYVAGCAVAVGWFTGNLSYQKKNNLLANMEAIKATKGKILGG